MSTNTNNDSKTQESLLEFALRFPGLVSFENEVSVRADVETGGAQRQAPPSSIASDERLRRVDASILNRLEAQDDNGAEDNTKNPTATPGSQAQTLEGSLTHEEVPVATAPDYIPPTVRLPPPQPATLPVAQSATLSSHTARVSKQVQKQPKETRKARDPAREVTTKKKGNRKIDAADLDAILKGWQSWSGLTSTKRPVLKLPPSGAVSGQFLPLDDGRQHETDLGSV